MKKTVKVAVAVLIVGVVVMLAGFAMAGFDLGNLIAGGALVERQYEAEGDVTELVVADRNADIVITPSEDGKARLTCWENEEAAYDIREEDGMLYIEKIEQRQNGLGAWFGFHQSGKLEIEAACRRARWTFPTTTAQCGWMAATPALLPHRDHRDGQRPHRTADASGRGRRPRNDNDSVTVENVTAETLSAETDNGSIDAQRRAGRNHHPAHRERQRAHGERRGGCAGSRHRQRRCDL